MSKFGGVCEVKFAAEVAVRGAARAVEVAAGAAPDSTVRCSSNAVQYLPTNTSSDRPHSTSLPCLYSTAFIYLAFILGPVVLPAVLPGALRGGPHQPVLQMALTARDKVGRAVAVVVFPGTAGPLHHQTAPVVPEQTKIPDHLLHSKRYQLSFHMLKKDEADSFKNYNLFV